MAYVTVSPTAPLGTPFPTQVAVTDKSATGSAWATAFVAGTKTTLATIIAQSLRNRSFMTCISYLSASGDGASQPRHDVSRWSPAAPSREEYFAPIQRCKAATRESSALD